MDVMTAVNDLRRERGLSSWTETEIATWIATDRSRFSARKKVTEAPPTAVPTSEDKLSEDSLPRKRGWKWYPRVESKRSTIFLAYAKLTPATSKMVAEATGLDVKSVSKVTDDLAGADFLRATGRRTKDGIYYELTERAMKAPTKVSRPSNSAPTRSTESPPPVERLADHPLLGALIRAVVQAIVPTLNEFLNQSREEAFAKQAETRKMLETALAQMP